MKLQLIDYTVFQKTAPFYFYNTFIIRAPISIIFENNISEKMCNKMLYFTSHLFCVRLLYLVTQAAILTNLTQFAVVSSCARRSFRHFNRRSWEIML